MPFAWCSEVMRCGKGPIRRRMRIAPRCIAVVKKSRNASWVGAKLPEQKQRHIAQHQYRKPKACWDPVLRPWQRPMRSCGATHRSPLKQADVDTIAVLETHTR